MLRLLRSSPFMSTGGWTSWTDAVWSCIELMDISVGSTFTLQDIYKAEDVLNESIQKIANQIKNRQQLQINRYGKLEFVNDMESQKNFLIFLQTNR